MASLPVLCSLWLPWINKRVLTGSSTHIRIRTQTRARVYLCIICKLSSSPDIITNSNTNRNTRIWTWYLHKYVEKPTDFPVFPPATPFHHAAASCNSSFWIVHCPSRQRGKWEATQAIWGEPLWSLPPSLYLSVQIVVQVSLEQLLIIIRYKGLSWECIMPLLWCVC